MGERERPRATARVARWHLVAAALVGGWMLVRVLWFLRGPDEALIGVIPDDAFYYLEMARHRAQDGFWSFDGVRTATGFHVLYGWLLVAAYKVFGALPVRPLFAVFGVAASAAMALSVSLVMQACERTLGRGAARFAALPFLAPFVVMQPTSLVEAPLVVLLAALTVFLVTRDGAPSRREAVLLVAVGVLGSLARSDFGLLPGLLLVVHAAAAVRVRDAGLRRSALLLAGAVGGVGLVLLQTYAISGRLTQASAAVKLHWSTLAGHNTTASMRLAEDVLLPTRAMVPRRVVNVTLGILCGGALLAFLRGTRREALSRLVPGLRIAVASALVVAGYVQFYAHNSQALQAWYVANLVVPSAVILAAFGAALATQPVVVGLAAAAPYLVASALGLLEVPYPHQPAMMRAGLALRSRADRGAFGSWNAGIISHYAGGGIVNVDGLTNDEVVPYVLSNRLVEYLRERRIRFLVDFEEMLERPSFRTRGGYDHPGLARCIVPVAGSEELAAEVPATSRLRIFEVTERPCE